MYRVCRQFRFDAAHRLVAPYVGKCERPHGHSWRVDIVVAAETLDPCGMVVDFSHFGALAEYIRQRFDHATVNDTVAQPTAENIARHVYDWARSRWAVERVRVWESAETWAEYAR